MDNIPQWIKDLPPVVVALVSASIALVSLGISGASLFISWFNYRRDRHRVVVELNWNAETEHVGDHRSRVKHSFGHIKVTNQGRRPVHIEMICLELPGRRRHINWLDESVKLEEGGSSKIIKVAQDSSLEPFVGRWKKIFATAVDNTGHTYKSRRGSERPNIFPGFDKETRRRLQEIKWPPEPK